MTATHVSGCGGSIQSRGRSKSRQREDRFASSASTLFFRYAVRAIPTHEGQSRLLRRLHRFGKQSPNLTGGGMGPPPPPVDMDGEQFVLPVAGQMSDGARNRRVPVDAITILA